MLGAHCLKHWSSTQPTIALSSGEAELAGLSRGATHALGFRHLARDLGWDFKITIFSDAIAALGIARRRGAGKIRHLSAQDLWIQEKVRNGELELQKVNGKENPGDLLTKHLPQSEMHAHMERLSMSRLGGRPTAAPQLVAAMPTMPPRRSVKT